MFLKNGIFPIVSQEQSLVNGYWDEAADVVDIEGPVVVFGDHTRTLKFVDFDFVVGADGVKILNPKDFLCAKYLYYFLLAHRPKELGYARHYRLLTDLEICFPCLSEQHRIVAILDEAFAGIETAIANTERNLSSARELFESYLDSVFSQPNETWNNILLSDVCSIASKLVDPRAPEHIDLPHVGAGNITPVTGELADVQTARAEALKSGKFTFDGSMVLYSKIRPYLTKVVRPEFEGLCSADIYPLAPKSEALTRDFFYYLLLSRDFTNYAIAGSARAGMPKVNRDYLFSYRTALPEIEEQKALVESFDAVALESKRLERLYKQKLNALGELKQSLLQRAFSGELTADEIEQEAEEAVA